MDLIHPASKADVLDAVRDANASSRRLLPVGGRRHLDKGNPTEIDAELWTTQLDRLGRCRLRDLGYPRGERRGHAPIAEAGEIAAQRGRHLVLVALLLHPPGGFPAAASTPSRSRPGPSQRHAAIVPRPSSSVGTIVNAR